MRLTSIPQLARDANRLREIVTTLSKYSLADWISRLDFEFVRSLFKRGQGTSLTQLTTETRIRLALSELGTTFIKLGQMLSTRADLIGPTLAQELSLLQAATPADPPETVRALVEAELKRPIAELFAEFDDEPLASASIGQVHRAKLPDGQRVVVKVQHHGIESKVKSDLEILAALAELAENNLADLAQYRPKATTAEFQRVLLRELDFGREERNLRQFADHFAADPKVRFPKSFPELSTRRVLTMEYLAGIPVADPDRLREAGYDLHDIARRGASIFLEMIFRDGFYHADPHPGNLFVLPDGVIGMLDCGMVGRLDEQLREDIEELLIAVVQGDARRLTAVITRVGSVPPRLDTAGLDADVSDFVSYYASQPMNKLELGRALNEMTGIIRRYHIILPTPIALLLKVLVMLEGTSRLLNPHFELIELIRPYQKKLIWRHLSPRRRLQKFRRLYQEWEHLGRLLPRSIIDLIQQAQGGKLELHVEHKRLESAVNRLVFGMMTSALFVGSSLMLSYKVPPAVWEISIPGAIGCSVSLMQALRLFWAIRNSGKLDQ
ncbi:MAG: AarF/ABC1/UbiB kinase family protein [Planctomycetia bacterium]|nr:AarF/ABC1/UbiB kinase family protein [Planctomycetia bacterium]